MLRITGWSLLFGAAALIAALALFYAPPANNSPPPPVPWNTSTGQAIAGTASFVDGAMQLALNQQGTGVVALAMQPIAASDYSFLHIALEGASPEPVVMISWNEPGSTDPSHIYALESKSLSSQWIATAELKDWSGSIGSLALVIMGQPGDTVVIHDFSLHPAGKLNQLRAVYSDLTAYEPWDRAAMNTYTGVTNVSSFYPLPLAAALLLFSLCAYGALVALSRGKLRFSRINVALIFLANWMILDAAWQNRLWHQLAETYRTFAHVESGQRQGAGSDAPFFSIASQIKGHLAPEARVIVASSDHYNGMRVAYYLYPHNVYWSVHDPQVPYDEYLRTGDYIALISPSTFRFNGRQGILSAPDRADLPAKLLFSNSTGTLVRLK
jgi:hypothetical protein